MSDHLTLAAELRSAGNAGELRSKGSIPAVIYGPALKGEVLNIAIDYQEFRKVFRVAGESTVIELHVDGKKLPALVHSIDADPVSNDFAHLDFYALDMHHEVHTHIPLTFVGTAPVVKEKSGILVTAKSELNVKCLPKDLVHDIPVDISGLVEFHDSILVKDLKIPTGITVLDHEEDVVMTATAPKVEEEAPVAEVAAGTEAEGAPAEGTPENAEDKKEEEK